MGHAFGEGEYGMDGALTRIADRLDIRDVYYRYARAVDRCDWSLLRSCFTSSANLNHLAYQGGIEGFIDWLIPRHASISISSHFIGSCLIEFKNNSEALVETYGIAFLRLTADATTLKKALLGDAVGDSDEVETEELVRYVDWFEKRDGRWLIANQNLISDARRVRVAGPDSWSLASFGVGLRNRDDELYRVSESRGMPR